FRSLTERARPHDSGLPRVKQEPRSWSRASENSRPISSVPPPGRLGPFRLAVPAETHNSVLSLVRAKKDRVRDPVLAAQLRDHPERSASRFHALDVVEAVAVRLRPVVPRGPRAV